MLGCSMKQRADHPIELEHYQLRDTTPGARNTYALRTHHDVDRAFTCPSIQSNSTCSDTDLSPCGMHPATGGGDPPIFGSALAALGGRAAPEVAWAIESELLSSLSVYLALPSGRARRTVVEPDPVYLRARFEEILDRFHLMAVRVGLLVLHRRHRVD